MENILAVMVGRLHLTFDSRFVRCEGLNSLASDVSQSKAVVLLFALGVGGSCFLVTFSCPEPEIAPR